MEYNFQNILKVNQIHKIDLNLLVKCLVEIQRNNYIS